jgi:RsiW-degrading membrane proteinase PrsW (M82 family)
MIVSYGLPSSLNQRMVDTNQAGARSRVSDLDFGGIISFAIAVIILLFLIQSLNTTDDQPRLLYLLVPALAVAIAVFILVEAYWAKKPLIPLNLVKTFLGGYYLGQLLLIMGRSAVGQP